MPARLERSESHAHVAIVTIDRPERANSLDPPTLRELAAAWQDAARDDDVRCVLLTGAGARVFCSGMDLATTIPVSQKLARGEQIDPEDFEGLRAVPIATLVEFDLGKPLVCAINGHCRAVGLDLMLTSEFRVAAAHATFGLEEVARGLYPTGQATVMLPRQLAWVHAQELMLTAQPIDAQRAYEIGLVNRVVPAERVMDTALEAAGHIAENAPLAVRATRAGVRELLHLSLKEAYQRQEELGKPLRKTEDAREGARAFLERRKPIWQGR
jgi:enoyl-CoA hydratase